MSGEMILSGHDTYMPVMSIDQAIARRDALVEYTRRCLIRDHDYGVIPGTGGKPTLYKPGAEKLCTMFGLTPRFEIVEQIEHWEPDTNGELLFSYVYRCTLFRGDRVIADAEAAANSREKKYRYRNSERVCPTCGQPAIRRGKKEWGGGFYCNGKAGGCGAKFPDGAPAIENQETGQMPNPDIPDLINTLRKMSQKRAFVSAVLTGVNASEFFTVDLEDAAPPAAATVDAGDDYVVSEAPPPDPVQEAAAKEAAERAEAQRREALKVQQTADAKEAFAAFTAKADEYAFNRTDRPSLQQLAKTLLKMDRPTTAALRSALDMDSQAWGMAIDDTHAALAQQQADAEKQAKPDATAGMSDGEKAAQEILTAPHEPTAAESALTLAAFVGGAGLR